MDRGYRIMHWLADGYFAGSQGWIWWIYVFLITGQSGVTAKTLAWVNQQGLTEYCDTETFTARCNHGEVVVMESAKYGRMKFGKCVDNDWGYMGCQTDVMLLADRWCSGRRSCQIPIPNAPFMSRSRSECPKDLNVYFEASFSCIKVQTAEAQECRTSKYILPSSPTRGVIANYLTMETSKGSEDCPWVIQARLGQRINITLMDFSRPNQDHISDRGPIYNVCHVYAVIKETMSNEEVNPDTVCGGGLMREKLVYVSKGHTLEVRIISSQLMTEERRYFLLKYEVYGCETPKPFPNTWIKRKDENHIVIGCSSGVNQLWEAKCINNIWHWDESVGNCTGIKSKAGGGDVGFLEFLLNIFALPLEYTLVVVIIIALAFLVMAVALGVCCVKVICPPKKKPQQHQIGTRRRHHSDNRPHNKAKPVQAVQPTTKPNPHKTEMPKAERQMDPEQGNLGNLPPPPDFLMESSDKEKGCETDEVMPPPPMSPSDPWPPKPPNMQLPPTPWQPPPSYNQVFHEDVVQRQNPGPCDPLEKEPHLKCHRRMPSDVTLTLQRIPRGQKPNRQQQQVPMSAGFQTNPHNSFEFPPPPKDFMRQTSEPGQERQRVRFQDTATLGYKRRDKRLSSDPLRNHIITPGTMRKNQQNPTSPKPKDNGQMKPQNYGSFSQQIMNARPPTEDTLTLDNLPAPQKNPRNDQTYFELEPESTVPYEMGYSVKTGRKFKVFHNDSQEKEKKMIKALESSPGAKKKRGNINNTM